MRTDSPLLFRLEAARVAAEPPEAHGASRDDVKLLVAADGTVTHTAFRDIARFLTDRDLLVVNTSPTMPAAIDGLLGGERVTVHVSTPTPTGDWIVELRMPDQSGPVLDAAPGQSIGLVGGGEIELLRPDDREPQNGSVRLWQAMVTSLADLPAHLHEHGRPIRYSYVDQPWPLSTYQTVFARPFGKVFASAEMASAGRPFTAAVVASVARAGIPIAPITLHAGVSSLENHEPPRPERFSVGPRTAAAIERTRSRSGRIIAVGTTVTRALETAALDDGSVRPSRGETSLVLDGSHPTKVVAGLITGWHAPEASHLQLLRAVAGDELVSKAYRAALDGDYLWHEFGDSCLLLPPRV